MKRLVMAVLLAMVMLAGCGHSGPVMEYGFLYKDAGDLDSNPMHCAYILSQSEFEKDNVFLELYYGGLGYHIYEEMYISVRLYMCGKDSSDFWNWYKDALLLKEISAEEYNRDDRYEWRGKEGYHETIRIPAEMFDRAKGSISFCFGEWLIEEQTMGTIESCTVNFELRDDKVILSVPTRR